MKPGKHRPGRLMDLNSVGAMYLEISTIIYGLNLTKPKVCISRRPVSRFDQVVEDLEIVGKGFVIGSQGLRYNLITGNL
jgi:hypothetical protein